MFGRAATALYFQLVDSEIESTRVYWRKEKWGMSDEIANDPRPMKEIRGDWPDWRKSPI